MKLYSWDSEPSCGTCKHLLPKDRCGQKRELKCKAVKQNGEWDFSDYSGWTPKGGKNA